MKKRLMLLISFFALLTVFCFQSAALDFDIVPFDELENGERIDYAILQEKIDKVYDALGVKKFDLKFTGEFAEIKDRIYEESNFDVDLFIGNLPDPFVAKRNVQEKLNIHFSDWKKAGLATVNERGIALTDAGMDVQNPLLVDCMDAFGL